MAKKERLESQVEEVKETPFMQAPTITDAVTRIMDADGNEIKQGDTVISNQ